MPKNRVVRVGLVLITSFLGCLISTVCLASPKCEELLSAKKIVLEHDSCDPYFPLDCSPKFHLGNYRQLSKIYDSKLFSSESVSVNITRVDSLNIYYLNMGLPFSLKEVASTPDGRFRILAAPFGLKIYIRKEHNYVEREKHLTRITHIATSEAINSGNWPNLEKPEVPLLNRTFQIKETDVGALVGELVANQSLGSSTHTRNGENISGALVEANTLMLELLTSQKTVTTEFLEKINKIVNRELDELTPEGNFVKYGTEEDVLLPKKLFTGIIRNSEKRSFIFNGINYEFQPDKTLAVPRAGGHFTYYPHSTVSQKINSLIRKINRIDKKTSFIQILEIHREFIFTHPFTEGNGRTSRVLLDYMIMKAGFYPLKHNMKSRDVVYQTLEELAASFFDQ